MSKLVNIADIEIWHTYLGKWSKYFALYHEDVGFYRFGPDNQDYENDPEKDGSGSHDSFMVEAVRTTEDQAIRLYITPMYKQAGEWAFHDPEEDDYLFITEVELSDPDGPKKIQEHIRMLFKFFNIKDSEIEHNLDNTLFESSEEDNDF